MVIAREQFNPEISKDYWLGYVAGHDTFSLWGEGVSGVYFGVWRGRHLFLNATSDGRIEKYSCPKNECYVVWWGEEDHPSISAPSVSFEGYADAEREGKATIDMVASGINQIREDNKRAWKNQLETMFAKAV